MRKRLAYRELFNIKVPEQKHSLTEIISSGG